MTEQEKSDELIALNSWETDNDYCSLGKRFLNKTEGKNGGN